MAHLHALCACVRWQAQRGRLCARPPPRGGTMGGISNPGPCIQQTHGTRIGGPEQLLNHTSRPLRSAGGGARAARPRAARTAGPTPAAPGARTAQTRPARSGPCTRRGTRPAAPPSSPPAAPGAPRAAFLAPLGERWRDASVLVYRVRTPCLRGRPAASGRAALLSCSARRGRGASAGKAAALQPGDCETRSAGPGQQRCALELSEHAYVCVHGQTSQAVVVNGVSSGWLAPPPGGCRTPGAARPAAGARLERAQRAELVAGVRKHGPRGLDQVAPLARVAADLRIGLVRRLLAQQRLRAVLQWPGYFLSQPLGLAEHRGTGRSREL